MENIQNLQQIHFLSDLHLSEQTPNLTKLFKDYLQNLDNQQVKNIYILGDFFDAWIGDDFLDYQNANFYAELCKFIKTIKLEKNINFYFLRGNRDFLVSQKFSEYSGIKILPDTYFLNDFVDLQLQIIMSHGDEFCTDDLPYMQFRNTCRNSQWQQQILALPIEKRLAMAQQIKLQSQADKNGIYKDINLASFDDFISKLNSTNNIVYIHGHTHIGGEHNSKIANSNVKRWVLSDWRESQNFAEISILTIDKNKQQNSYSLQRKQL